MRIDRLLVERGLFESRARAQAAVAAGLVRVEGVVVPKPSAEVAEDARIEAADVHDYVSRGGLKLEAGLQAFGIDPAALTAMDVGASTGGFTDVLLRHRVAHVYAVDVGRGQFHESLRGHPQITLLEETDIRALDRAAVPDPVDVVVVDVSFISLRQVLPSALAFAAPRARLVALVKPQFEAGREAVKKGIVRDAAVRQEVCTAAEDLVTSLGWRVLGIVPSPITGGDGNVEYLLGAERA
ncbi:TlyA family RNA methyltransferase [Xanthobacter sediminis]|uniref:TlyA family RNA methyltransferase n=1 Tax=Xanthobacter sediminis TaxID=3119926 RepID=UPI00372A88C7